LTFLLTYTRITFTNILIRLFFFSCRTIPHLCRWLKFRNWNSAIARGIHTIWRNLV